MTRRRRLVIVLGLNVVLVAGLAVVGWRAHSLAVLAAGIDYLADAAAICIALAAIEWGRRRATDDRRGPSRAESIAALVNGGWLLLFCAGVIGDAISRLTQGSGPVDGLPVALVSALAAVLMGGAALVLRDSGSDGGDPHVDAASDLNFRAVLLDTVADAAASAGAALAGLVIFVTGENYWVDPAVAIIVAGAVTLPTVKLLTSVIHELRSSVPVSR